ncbi:MAG: hypothetical protein A2487_11870 [Candidatus Raymondbacteria bacterium RifOxyC12_full_50_8]|uniref:Secretion system C-terminal sorting domain-containing protein n=1 Tax=Candidatus Raymondbacteria bacterium RIFOXYD12_FULL_49_13 TaxID=1817890 RepID=A0A1F7F6T4_UNCRA|nr:MAG: hypothetical protein A2248_13060 [Candidatus Raymondbacteria bacterium RIFOXYA2_FULL_49_16]OGJ95732.1 MAG: hypothetical protein A2487_11870 [Candidatus Raymondbacteria bacterium RifOxyC12_full_50_8]OGJ96028.1 MAG: hypothetical protein A2350_04500 [Candidatus Raymondbacteria bacterium RifOxyB12_full_50_8]OGK02216.1 MAG: hypothetical protein A2519_16175 [Candidatus Raymondbacteria bacterium RIFOXYD12_FULL_49_13]OGP45171.1 MAG: hypothetical protein A2324_12295 [Candidatus Raymondbacteria b
MKSNNRIPAIFANIFLVSLMLSVQLQAQSVQPAAWVPADLATKLAIAPQTSMDQEILADIDSFQTKIAALDMSNTYVQKLLSQLQEKVFILYREYNLDHARSAFENCDWTVAECLPTLRNEMSFYLGRLKAGTNPFMIPGRNLGYVYWNSNKQIMGQYTLITPGYYLYANATPAIISQQGDPGSQLQLTPYILICRFKKDYQWDDVKLEAMLKAIILDAAGFVHIDPFRLYTTGFSHGGHTCLSLSWRFQDWFAASVPVHNSLGYNTNLAFVAVPTRLIHGTLDEWYDTRQYPFMVESGCTVEQILFITNHNSDIPFADSAELITEFCDRYVMNPYPKTVHHNMEDISYSRAFWTNVKVSSGSVTNAEYTIDVGPGNVITITQANQNITGFDFYLQDSLVNMSQPVAVVYGTDTVYNSMPAAKISVTIRTGAQISEGNERLLWQELDSLQCTIFGSCSPYQIRVEDTPRNIASAGQLEITAIPNPFNPRTKILVSSPHLAGEVGGQRLAGGKNASIKIFNVHGTLVHKQYTTGYQLSAGIIWNASYIPSGIYIVQIRYGDLLASRAITLLK